MSSDVPAAMPAPPRRSMVPALLCVVGLAATGAGLVLLLRAGAGRVETIRVTKHSMLPEAFVGSPDYYLEIGTLDKQEIETEGYSDTPIGNGLDFKLPKPLALEQISHIELMDTDVGSDDIRDRVDVRERVCRGQDYEFELIGPPALRRTAGIATLAGGGAVLIIGVILLVRSHAI